MKIFIATGKCILEFIYLLIKLFPVRNQIAFISRQSNKPSLDIKMLAERLEHDGQNIRIACKTLESGIASHIKYCFHMFKQMYLISTSKVVVLDSYCIIASLLEHKKQTKIIQMWHALGSLKKFGYSIVGKGEGSGEELAHLMKMHRNYDVIFASSSVSRRAFAEAFDYPEDRFKVLSLPRVDALLDKKRDAETAEKIYQQYPQLKEKKNILYAPTFRKQLDISEQILKLVDTVGYENYNLIVKLHPLSNYPNDNVRQAIFDKKYSTLDMLSISDYVITDYSAITYEAALKGKPIYFYAFDLDEYLSDRSFYLDYEKEMPGMISASADEIIAHIEGSRADVDEVELFADKYIENKMNCTEEITAFLVDLLEK